MTKENNHFDDLDDPVINEIISARIQLLSSWRFFGEQMVRLKIVDASDWCETTATDGVCLYFNRQHIKSLTRQELLFTLAHLVLHCVLDHLGRRNKRNKEIWDAATDYLVNATILGITKNPFNEKGPLGKMPEGGLYDPRFTDQMSVEEIYEILLKEAEKEEKESKENGSGQGSGQGSGKGSSNDDDDDSDEQADGEESGSDSSNESGKGKGKGKGKPSNGKPSKDQKGKGKGAKKPLDEHMDLGDDAEDGEGDGQDQGNGNGKGGKPRPLTEEELRNIRNDIRSTLINQATMMGSKGAGQIPAGILRLIEELIEPKLNWRELIEVVIQSIVKDDYTYNRLNKRSWSWNMCLPDRKNQDTIDVMVFIDASGSIDNEMLRDFLSETKGIMQCFPAFTLRIATFDTTVYNYQVFTEENINDIDTYEIGGGGGTLFEAMFVFMQTEEIEPKKLIVFTDGYPCGSWGDETYCDDVLWVIHEDKNVVPPFGMHVLYNDGKNKRR